MTRVRFLVAVSCAAMMLAACNVNAQCSSCAQGVQPVFNQGYVAPANNYVAAPYFSATANSMSTSYMPQQVSYASPVSSGCSSCGTAGYAAPQATFVMAPVSSGCVGCSQTSNAMMVQPVSSGCSGCTQGQGTWTSLAPVPPVSTGCNSCGTAGYQLPQATYAMAPVSSGCVGCGQSSNAMMVQPVSSGCSGCTQAQGTWTSMAPVSACSASANSGCSTCATTCQSQQQTRVRIFGQRRNNNCSTCN